MNLTLDLQKEADDWKNEDLYNELLHSRFTKLVNEDAVLNAHRTWVEQNQFGFGDRAFGYAWKLLIDSMPQHFSFLEIGVFKGQITSLVALLAKHSNKAARVFGVTTLENTPDERCKYPAGNYSSWIFEIHRHFEVGQPTLIVGRSTDVHVLTHIGPMDFDIVYIDGNHDYKIVSEDINNYSQRVRAGGFLVMDDASIDRLHIGSCWPGLPDVARAVREQLDNNPKFKFLFACGHLNLFQKVAP